MGTSEWKERALLLLLMMIMKIKMIVMIVMKILGVCLYPSTPTPVTHQFPLTIYTELKITLPANQFDIHMFC
jgi:hypothetical protein